MLVFVYGTLRRGARMAADTQFGAEFVESDAVRGSIFDVGWYPGYKQTEGYAPVSGDIFKVDYDQLSRLDAYEGCPHLYSRKRVETLSGREVFIYEYNGELSPDDLIIDGDWLAYENEKERGEYA